MHYIIRESIKKYLFHESEILYEKTRKIKYIKLSNRLFYIEFIENLGLTNYNYDKGGNYYSD